MAAAAAIAWLPLFLLFDRREPVWIETAIPFLGDFAVNIRLLITLPLLVSAEAVIERRARSAFSTQS